MGTMNSGVPDQIYGRGLLNLAAAIQAQGQNLLSYNFSVSMMVAADGTHNTSASSGYDVRSSSFAVDPIFGDAFTSNVIPQLSSAVFFDDYGRDFRANLGNKITQKTTTNLGYSSMIINNYDTKNVPLRFGKNFASEINVQYKSYKDATLAKMMMVDKSQEDKTLANSAGFSFTQNFSNSFKAGFSFNNNEVVNMKNDNFGFLSVSNISASPFQSFVTNQGVANLQNQKNFNQIFLSKSFFNQKFALNFSHQASYLNSSGRNSPLAKSSTKQNELSDLGFSYFSPNKETNIAFSFGNLNEFNNNFLNSQALGAFETAGDVKTSYAKISVAKKLFDGLTLISSFGQGKTVANGNSQGIFRNYHDINSRSSAIGLTSDKFFKGDFGIIYSQPLRVYSGSATIDVPIGIKANGNALRYNANVSLKPQGREEDYEVFFAKNLSNNSRFRLNFITQKQPGNVKDANNVYSLIGNYSRQF
jgi:hypothetical protein